MGEFSSAGRALALQARGHRFEPCNSHHIHGAVVQLVRMPACHAGGRGFEPLLRRQKLLDGALAQIAQLVEQWTENPRVAGSIPALGTRRSLFKGASFFIFFLRNCQSLQMWTNGMLCIDQNCSDYFFAAFFAVASKNVNK